MTGRRILAAIFTGFLCANAYAETTSLAEFLRRAGEDGINVLFSTDLVPQRYQVTFDPGEPVTEAKLRRALEGFDLELMEAAPGVLTVVRRRVLPDPIVPDPLQMPVLPAIEELIVTSSRYQLLMRDGLASSQLVQEQLSQRPAVGNDPARLVNQLPGSNNDGMTARPRVRGGGEDETLILFDGVRLYKPFHFNAFNNLVSTFDARLIDSLEFYSGGFPVNMGDRLSAAMVIETTGISPSRREAGVGLYNLSYLHHERSWIVNVRRSTLELVSGLAEHDPGTPSFADVYGRYEWLSGSGHEWSANLLWFGDDMELTRGSGLEHATSIYGNTYAWLNWRADWSEALSSESWFSVAGVKDDRNASVNNPGVVIGTLSDSREFRVYQLKHEFSYLASADWLWTAGMDYRYISAQYDFARAATVAPVFASLTTVALPSSYSVNVDESGHQLATWLSGRTRFGDRLTLETGVRLDLQHYEHDLHASQTSPRVSILYEPAEDWDVRLGWGRFTQAEGLHELKISDGFTHFQLPQRSTHVNLGVHTRVFDVDVRIELYRKRGHVSATYFENLASPVTLVPELQPDRIAVSPDSFVAEGVELSLDGSLHEVDWWFNYSYSSASDLLGTVETRRAWDNRHSANAGVSHEVWGWNVATTMSCHSSWSTTPLVFDGIAIRSGERNSVDFGNYASVDIKMMKTWQMGKDELRVEMGLTNLTNRENVIGFEYTFEGGALARSEREGLPLAPFVDLFWRF